MAESTAYRRAHRGPLFAAAREHIRPPYRRRPRQAARVTAGTALGLSAALVGLLLWPALRPGTNADIDPVILGARALAAGADPYLDSWRYVGPGWHWPLQYPVPALLAVLPLAPLPLELGRAVFIGLGVGLLAFGLTRNAWWPIILLTSGPALEAAILAQWSPVVTAGSVIPGLAWVLACKPNLGLCLWLGSPDRATARRLAYAAAGALLVSLLIVPAWPRSYLSALTHTPHHSLVTRPFGWLLLLAALRWRDSAGRLLTALALVPQSASFYDGLPALLAARRKREALLLSGTSLVGYLLVLGRDKSGLEYSDIVAQAWPVVLVTLYLPALALVLGRAYSERAAGRPSGARPEDAAAAAARQASAQADSTPSQKRPSSEGDA